MEDPEKRRCGSVVFFARFKAGCIPGIGVENAGIAVSTSFGRIEQGRAFTVAALEKHDRKVQIDFRGHCTFAMGFV